MQHHDDGTIPSQVQLPPRANSNNPPNAPESNSVRGSSGRAGDAFASQNNGDNG